MPALMVINGVFKYYDETNYISRKLMSVELSAHKLGKVKEGINWDRKSKVNEANNIQII